MIIELVGDPIPKARHRYFIRHGAICSYDPQEEAKNATRHLLAAKFRDQLNHEDRKISIEASNLTRSNVFKVDLYFGLPIPKSATQSERSLLLWIGEANTKPDVDNLAKFYLDCANGILWPDDKQVVSLTVKKSFTDKPKTVIKIEGTRIMTLHSSIEGILKIMDPAEFLEFTIDVLNAYEDFCKDFTPDKIRDGIPTDADRQEYATRAALLLSRLADTHADKLKKIKTKYPNFWKEWTGIQNKIAKGLHDEAPDKFIPLP